MKRLASLALLLCMVGCNQSNNGGEAHQAEARPVNVRTIKVEPSSHAHQSRYVGVVEERNTANLSFAVAGTISRIFAQEGESVRAGELLMQLAAPNIAEMLSSAEATYEQARDGFERAEMLYESQSMPELEFIDARTKLDQARSALKIAQKNLDYTYLRAPYDGVVGRRIATVGEVILPAMPVITLLEMDGVVAKIAVPEGEISSIEAGARATIEVGALPGERFRGEVLSHGVVSDPVSHTYEVMVGIESRGGKLLPGMIAKIAIESEEEQSISIPNRAIILGRGAERFLWVVESGKATRREVEIGGLSHDGVVITSGLRPGDEVIVEGYQKVSVGSKVEATR